MRNSETVEKLAAAIAEEVYIDIAKWHLYLNDAHLDVTLAEQFYQILTESGKAIDQDKVTDVLNKIKVKVGGGKREIPLSDLIPTEIQSRLLDVVDNFSETF